MNFFRVIMTPSIMSLISLGVDVAQVLHLVARAVASKRMGEACRNKVYGANNPKISCAFPFASTVHYCLFYYTNLYFWRFGSNSCESLSSVYGPYFS